MKLIAKKDLKHSDGTISFVKGKVYSSKYDYATNLTVTTIIINEQGEDHCLGSPGWVNSFKVIK